VEREGRRDEMPVRSRKIKLAVKHGAVTGLTPDTLERCRWKKTEGGRFPSRQMARFAVISSAKVV